MNGQRRLLVGSIVVIVLVVLGWTAWSARTSFASRTIFSRCTSCGALQSKREGRLWGWIIPLGSPSVQGSPLTTILAPASGRCAHQWTLRYIESDIVSYRQPDPPSQIVAHRLTDIEESLSADALSALRAVLPDFADRVRNDVVAAEPAGLPLARAYLLAAVAAELALRLGGPDAERAREFAASMLVHGWDVLRHDDKRRKRKGVGAQLRARQLLTVWTMTAAKRWCGDDTAAGAGQPSDQPAGRPPGRSAGEPVHKPAADDSKDAEFQREFALSVIAHFLEQSDDADREPPP